MYGDEPVTPAEQAVFDGTIAYIERVLFDYQHFWALGVFGAIFFALCPWIIRDGFRLRGR